ncbi:MAG: formylmethanofuran--tetrahydromethanopterin N-formyltransferase [Nitrospinae bacterium]|nr:formylmethanofuran--tetrahydromethanopterin N-formyltransferase [Nitrospinota bacterium]
MKINKVLIDDAACEAFRMKCARLLVTAHDHYWLDEAVRTATGLATSIIACDVEAGLEIKTDSTPDGRPGAYLLFFGRTLDGLGKSLLTRIGQGLMTCPTTAVFNAMQGGEVLDVGRKLAYFGDGFEEPKTLWERRMWSIPVTEGEFLVEETFNIGDGVAGGAFIVMAESLESALTAVTRARDAINPLPGVILPFPGGSARCASKVGAVKYPFLKASTNAQFCPTLKGRVASKVPDGVTCALEVVIDGVDEESVKSAMRAGIHAACEANGVKMITAASFGGRLGGIKISLRETI